MPWIILSQRYGRKSSGAMPKNCWPIHLLGKYNSPRNSACSTYVPFRNAEWVYQGFQVINMTTTISSRIAVTARNLRVARG